MSLSDADAAFIVAPALGTLLGLFLLFCFYRALTALYRLLCTYSGKELLNILKNNPGLGIPVHAVDVGLYRVTGHKFLYPDNAPVDPNLFDGLMTSEQFAQVMTIINSAIIESLTGAYKSCIGVDTAEKQRWMGYAEANIACRKATAYLQQNNVRAVVYQTIDNEIEHYYFLCYLGSEWDTSVYISFRHEDLEGLETGAIGLATQVDNLSVARDMVPVATVAPFSGSAGEEFMFAHILDVYVLKVAKDLRTFYNLHDPSRTVLQIETAARWATEHGLDALNERLRVKYGHDLNILRREPPI